MTKRRISKVDPRFLLAVALAIMLLNGIVIFSMSRNSGRHSAD